MSWLLTDNAITVSVPPPSKSVTALGSGAWKPDGMSVALMMNVPALPQSPSAPAWLACATPEPPKTPSVPTMNAARPILRLVMTSPLPQSLLMSLCYPVVEVNVGISRFGRLSTPVFGGIDTHSGKDLARNACKRGVVRPRRRHGFESRMGLLARIVEP